MILEVCAFNVQSAIVAQKAGAKRVELCDNPVEGGTTPSSGAISLARELISIELYPIIRPRAGDYCYDDIEFKIIKRDIQLCKELGCDGISVGVQRPSGQIDYERMKQVVEWAYPMGVTCNRAFDAVPNPYAALEELINAGCERVLTSGQETAAPDGSAMLKKLVEQANGRIIIMPGAGVKSSNLQKLIEETGATEYHTSARKVMKMSAEYQN
ncbi:MAG: copper homeostasis protein CutC, partial [Flavitalea sp.]